MPSSYILDASTRSAHGNPLYQTYHVFDTILRSEIPLPELSACTGYNYGVTTRLAAPGEFGLEGFATCHDWHDSGGRLTLRTARRGEDYLLSFPEMGRFLIAPKGNISCVPESVAGEYLVRQLLLNQVLPRYLAHTGELVLHASAVTLPDGKVVAFLGESGYGKSTLASYCHQQGARLIDDDCILLRSAQGTTHVIGGVPTVRLYPDSLQALSHDPDAFVPYMEYSNKQQMRLAEGVTPGTASCTLDALFLLDAPGEPPVADSVLIEPATGQAAVMAMVGSAFNLDPSDHDTMTRTFQGATRLLQQGLPVFHLRYPRVHARLPTVLQALLEHPLG